MIEHPKLVHWKKAVDHIQCVNNLWVLRVLLHTDDGIMYTESWLDRDHRDKATAKKWIYQAAKKKLQSTGPEVIVLSIEDEPRQK